MSYNKRVWANRDLITKERMNNIENGIYDAHDELEKANRKIEENTTDSNTSKQDISDIKTEIGTEELTTNAKNIKAAINEHDSQIKNIATKKIYQFDSVISMKSYNLKEGEVCETLGYYSANDGGAGRYYIVNSVTDNYNGISIITLNNGKKAVLVVDSNTINSIVFGDKTGTSDDTTFLNNIIKYCSDYNIELKMIKGKNYNTTGNLYFKSNTKIDFNDATLTLLPNNNRSIFLNLDAYQNISEETKIRNVVMKNLTVNGNAATNCTDNLSGMFINAYNLSNCLFENIKLSYCYRNNFNIYYGEYLTFKNIEISHMGETLNGINISGGNYGIEINYGKHILFNNIRGTELVGGTIHVRFVEFVDLDNLYCYNNYSKNGGEQASIGLTLTNCKYVKCKNIDMDTIDRNGIELNEQTINTSFENVKITNTLSPIVVGCNSDDTVVNGNVYFNNIKVSSTADTNYGVTINYVHGVVFDNFEINCLIGANDKVDGIIFRNGKITAGDSDVNGGSLFGSKGFEVQNVTINSIYYKHLIPNKIVNLIFTGQITQQSSVNLDLNFLKRHTNTFGELFIKSYFESSPDQFYIAKYLFGLSNNTGDSGIISNLIIEVGSNYRKVTPSISSPGILTLSTTSDVDIGYIIELY